MALREGLILDYVRRNEQHIAAVERYPDIRRRSVEELGERCHYWSEHARQVARLALALFDQTAGRPRPRTARARVAEIRGAPARRRRPHQLPQPSPALALPDPARRPARLRSRGDRDHRPHRALSPPGHAEEVARRLRRPDGARSAASSACCPPSCASPRASIAATRRLVAGLEGVGRRRRPRGRGSTSPATPSSNCGRRERYLPPLETELECPGPRRRAERASAARRLRKSAPGALDFSPMSSRAPVSPCPLGAGPRRWTATARTTPGAPLKIDVQGLNFYYGPKQRADRHHHRHARQSRHRVHRSVGLRQEHVPAHAEPDERHHRRHPRRGLGEDRRRRRLRAGHRRRRPAPPRRHGVPEVEPVPQVDLRERRLRPPPERAGREPGASCRSGSKRACARRRSGTRSRIGCTNRRSPSRAASSSACASPAPWPSSRRCC